MQPIKIIFVLKYCKYKSMEQNWPDPQKLCHCVLCRVKIMGMHIDSYEFGRIVIDGTSYNSDCLILGDSVQPNWWRKQGHSLSVEDIEPIIAAKPSVLIVGCGASGLMKVPDTTRQVLQEHNIQLEALNTYKAVQRFNELSQEGANIAAALHLTC